MLQFKRNHINENTARSGGCCSGFGGFVSRKKTMSNRKLHALLVGGIVEFGLACQGFASVDLELRAPAVVEDYRRKLQNRVNMLLADTNVELHEDMLLREVAVYADRCDISEELQRLNSHLDQFVELCDGSDSAGRRLDFLTQEMLRESNTIGSKANDATISRNVVEIKNYVDRLREQVQNVE